MRDKKQVAAIAEKVRPRGTPSGAVGSAGYVNRKPYVGSAVDKSAQTVNTRRQTGTMPQNGLLGGGLEGE